MPHRSPHLLSWEPATSLLEPLAMFSFCPTSWSVPFHAPPARVINKIVQGRPQQVPAHKRERGSVAEIHARTSSPMLFLLVSPPGFVVADNHRNRLPEEIGREFREG